MRPIRCPGHAIFVPLLQKLLDIPFKRNIFKIFYIFFFILHLQVSAMKKYFG
jgi:ATP/ADP translocase